jgi:hypothetical protein
MKKKKFAILAGIAGVAAGAAAAAFAWLKHKSEDTYYIDISDDATVTDAHGEPEMQPQQPDPAENSADAQSSEESAADEDLPEESE